MLSKKFKEKQEIVLKSDVTKQGIVYNPIKAVERPKINAWLRCMREFDHAQLAEDVEQGYVFCCWQNSYFTVEKEENIMPLTDNIRILYGQK